MLALSLKFAVLHAAEQHSPATCIKPPGQSTDILEFF
jgi:hypothetical protein